MPLAPELPAWHTPSAISLCENRWPRAGITCGAPNADVDVLLASLAPCWLTLWSTTVSTKWTRSARWRSCVALARRARPSVCVW